MPKKKIQTSTKTTKCTICGQIIEYKTKKPSKCRQCSAINAAPKLPKTKWKKETQMIRAMSELFPGSEYIVNGYYSWLLSPKGMAMQLDWYCPDVKVGCEFNGQQHYEQVKYFQKTKKAFMYQQSCDSIKSKLCKDRGITLLSIPYNISVTVQFMREQLKKENPSLYDALVQSKKLQGGQDDQSNN